MTWSRVGVVAMLQVPGDALASAACPDFSGDGVGDNGLVKLAPTLNPELANAIPSSLAILFEFVGVDDPTADNPAFKLVVLMGKPTAPGATTYQVDPTSYDLTTLSGECRPLIFFDGAKIAHKGLTAGPSLLSLTVPVQELGGSVSATIQQTRLSATLTDGSVAATGPDPVEVVEPAPDVIETAAPDAFVCAQSSDCDGLPAMGGCVGGYWTCDTAHCNFHCGFPPDAVGEQ